MSFIFSIIKQNRKPIESGTAGMINKLAARLHCAYIHSFSISNRTARNQNCGQNNHQGDERPLMKNRDSPGPHPMKKVWAYKINNRMPPTISRAFLDRENLETSWRCAVSHLREVLECLKWRKLQDGKQVRIGNLKLNPE